MRRPVHSALVLTLAGLAGLSGCDLRRHEVTGRVTYNGAPLHRTGGQVVFVGPGGQQVAAPIGADGSYSATGLVAGTHRLAVYYLHPRVTSAASWTPLGPAKGRVARDTHGPVLLTPAKYASPEQSGLSVSVEGDVVRDLALAGPPIP